MRNIISLISGLALSIAFIISASAASSTITEQTVYSKAGEWRGEIKLVSGPGSFVSQNDSYLGDLHHFSIKACRSYTFKFHGEKGSHYKISLEKVLHNQTANVFSERLGRKNSGCLFDVSVVNAQGDINVKSHLIGDAKECNYLNSKGRSFRVK